MDQLSEKYDEVHLLRNEKHFKLYNFGDDQVFEPDFLLHLSRDKRKEELIYQVFIEHKGAQLLEADSWKEDFLLEIEKQHELNPLFVNKDYRLLGLPFFNHTERKENFEHAFIELFK